MVIVNNNRVIFSIRSFLIGNMITSYHMIDLVVFIIANMTNLLLIVMFFLRARGRPKIGFSIGLFSVALGIPLAVVGIANLLGGRPW